MTNPVGAPSPIPYSPRRNSSASSGAQSASPVEPADRLDLSKAGSPGIEADLSLALIGRQVAPNGTISLKRAVVERSLQQALQGLIDPKVAFDSSKGTYNLTAKTQVMGMQVPFSASIHLVADHDKIGFAIEGARVQGIGLTRLTKMLSETLAKKLSEGGLQAQADSARGIVSFDTTSLLHQIKALPYYLAIASDQTKLSLNTSPQGDVSIGFQSERQGPAITPTKDSDLAISFDDKALTAILQEALLQDADIQKVTLRDGGLQIDGKAEVKEASALLSAGKLLLALAALSSGGNVNADPVEVKVPVSLDLEFQGKDVVLKPDSSLYLGPLQNALKQAAPVREGDSLRIDLEALVAKQGVLEGIEVTPEGLKVRFHANADSLL